MIRSTLSTVPKALPLLTSCHSSLFSPKKYASSAPLPFVGRYEGFQYIGRLQYPKQSDIGRFISKETMTLQYNFQLEAIRKLNKLLLGVNWPDEGRALYYQKLSKLTLDKIVQTVVDDRQNAIIFNAAAEAYNHEIFFKCLTPSEQDPEAPGPSPVLEAAFNLHFGGFEKFKEKFNTEARNTFGSGWVWLFESAGHLHVMKFQNAETPIGLGPAITPLLGLDLWEHAYYLDYHNDRESYIQNFWSAINWEFVNNQFEGTLHGLV